MNKKFNSLPEWLRRFVDEQFATSGIEPPNADLYEFIRANFDRQSVRELLMTGLQSPLTASADEAFFEGLRTWVRGY